MNATTPSHQAAADYALPTRSRGPLIIAVQGGEGSAAVLEAAWVIGARFGTVPHVVGVVEPPAAYVTGIGIELVPPDVVAEQRVLMRGAIEQKMDVALGRGVRWPIEIVVGPPAHALARHARERDARWIVMGLGRHAPIDRVFGTETTLHTLRAADRPVLAVAEGLSALPRHVVVAVDFSPASVRAAEEALAMLADGGTLSLVHVRYPFGDAAASPGEAWDLAHDQSVGDLFHRVVALLHAPATVCVQWAMPAGDPADEVLAYARDVGADLVAAGSSGAGLLQRMLVGSVATRLLRRTPISLLVVPTPAAAESERIERRLACTERTSDAERWSALVQLFGRRNAGRPTQLELEDRGVGMAVQESGAVLQDAAYDRHDGRLELMMGGAAHGDRTLVHTVPDIVSIGVRNDPDGRDRALEVEHRRGRACLRLLD